MLNQPRPLGQRQRSFDQLHSSIKEHSHSSSIGASGSARFSFSAFEVPSQKPSYRFRRQAIEAIAVSSVGWLVVISLVCAVICSLLIPDINVKGKFQAGITGLASSGAWVIWLIEELIRAVITFVWALGSLVLALLSSVAALLKSSQIQWPRWFSWDKLQTFCFRPPGASHVRLQGTSWLL